MKSSESHSSKIGTSQIGELKREEHLGGAPNCKITGHFDPDHAQSLVEFALPIASPKSKGWLLRKRISDSDAGDAMGCYPLFACENWRSLAEDIEAPRERLVKPNVSLLPPQMEKMVARILVLATRQAVCVQVVGKVCATISEALESAGLIRAALKSVAAPAGELVS